MDANLDKLRKLENTGALNGGERARAADLTAGSSR